MPRLSDLGVILSFSLLSIAGGLGTGYLFWGHQGQDDPIVTEEGDDDSDHHDHIDISAVAAKNLGLSFGPVTLETFRKLLPIPGMVVEKPGQSGLAVTSPTQGIVREVHRFPGQALSPGDLLFTLRVTDEALEGAQLSLLEILTRITVTEREIARLDPLADAGAIVGRRKLEMEYQLKQLNSERDARLQELRLRGLNAAQIERIVDERELVSEIEVRLGIAAGVETGVLSQQVTLVTELETTNGLDSSSDPDPIYTVEKLNVFPGRAVQKGEELCHIASHSELFVRGEAFETDLPAIRKLNERGWGIAAEFGQEQGRFRVEDLSVTYIDNHVDPETQTFPFYLSLPNRVVAEHRDAAGRLFRSWQFKPGQRAHLSVPVEEWPAQIVLPRDAVVRSGPEVFVFRLEDEQGADKLPATVTERLAMLAEVPELELEPVSVQLLHQDRWNCVIAADGELREGDIIAMNRAYQIHLAWKLQLSGGGHHHDHDH